MAKTTNAIADDDFMVGRLTIDWNKKFTSTTEIKRILQVYWVIKKLYDKIKTSQRFLE